MAIKDIKFKKAIQVKDWKGSGNLNLTNLNQETAGYIYGKDAFKNDILRKSNPNPEAFRDATSLRINLNLFKFEQDSSYSLSPYFRKTKMNFLQHYLPGTPLEDNDHWKEDIPYSPICQWLNVNRNPYRILLFSFQILQFTIKDPLLFNDHYLG